MKCPKCNSDNPRTSKFCQECGYPLSQSPEIQAPLNAQRPRKAWYKRWYIWVAIGVVSTILLAYFSPKSEKPTKETTATVETTAAANHDSNKAAKQTSAVKTTEAAAESKELVVFNENGIKLIYTGYDDSLFIPAFTFVLENNSNKSFHVSSEDESINDSMISTGIWESVAPGKKTVCEMSVYKSDLEKNGIENIEKLEFKLHYFNKDDIMESYDSGVITITNP